MVDPKTVLWGQTIAYTCYCLAIMALIAWFAFKVTRKANEKPFNSAIFYAFFAFLVVLGVSLHIVTHETIPWKAMDLGRARIAADREFEITIADHEFKLPAERMVIKKGEIVRFNGHVRRPDLRVRALPARQLDALPDAGPAGAHERHPLALRPARPLHHPVHGILGLEGHPHDRPATPSKSSNDADGKEDCHEIHPNPHQRRTGPVQTRLLDPHAENDPALRRRRPRLLSSSPSSKA